jgi:hypothetical protein
MESLTSKSSKEKSISIKDSNESFSFFIISFRISFSKKLLIISEISIFFLSKVFAFLFLFCFVFYFICSSLFEGMKKHLFCSNFLIFYIFHFVFYCFSFVSFFVFLCSLILPLRIIA